MVCESVNELVSQLGSWLNDADLQENQPNELDDGSCEKGFAEVVQLMVCE